MGVTISTNMDNIDNKIGNIQETILKHQADIVNIQETSSFHTETAKYVDRLSTRMDSIDEERKKSEMEMIANNEKLIADNAEQIDEMKVDFANKLAIMGKSNEDVVEKLNQTLN